MDERIREWIEVLVDEGIDCGLWLELGVTYIGILVLLCLLFTLGMVNAECRPMFCCFIVDVYFLLYLTFGYSILLISLSILRVEPACVTLLYSACWDGSGLMVSCSCFFIQYG
ncbi:hypothetical protein BDV18DRAFT_44690 [Aspergillus unguis]